jgi:hypothetical protein
VTPQTRNPRGRTGRLLAALLAGALLSGVGGLVAAAPAAAVTSVGDVLTITNTPPAATADQLYGFAFTTSGAGPVTFAVVGGTPPAGLSVSSDGHISGTPTTVGPGSPFTVEASNGVDPDADVTVTIPVNPSAPGLSDSLVAGDQLGVFFSHQYTVTGNPAPELTWTTLPPGVTLAQDGTLSGTPTEAGFFTFTITASNGADPDATLTDTLYVLDLSGLANAPTIQGTPPDAQVGAEYGFSYTLGGPRTPVTTELSQGQGDLPPGLTLSSDGRLSGIPTTAGSYSFVVTADNGSNAIAARDSTITVAPAAVSPGITGTPPGGQVGVRYEFAYMLTGEATTTASPGTLPPGLSLSADGHLTGTPTTAGTYTFSVSAGNGGPVVAATENTITIAPVSPGITGTPPGGQVGVGYEFAYTLTGDATTTVLPTTLPPGLALSADGHLTGTPTTAGTYTFSVSAGNGGPVVAATENTITIAPAAPPVTLTGTPPAAGVGEPYGFSFTRTGDPTVTKSAGSLPPGVSLSSSGRLSGTPTRAGSYSFTVRAVARSAAPVTRNVTLVVRPAPTVSVSCAVVPEGNSGTRPLTVTVALSRASTVPVSVRWSTANGTAVAGSDYTAASGTVTFAPGQTSKTVSVQVRGDRTRERDESFVVRLASPTHATIGIGTAVAAIRNDD